MSDAKLPAAVHSFLLQQGLVKTARQLAKDFFDYERKEDFAYDATSISRN